MRFREWLPVLSLLAIGCEQPRAWADGTAATAVERYSRAQHIRFDYRLSADGSRVTLARGVVSASLAGDPASSCRRFLLDHRDLFGIAPDEMDASVARVIPGHGATHVTFAQVIGGVPVMGPASAVHFDGDSRVILVQNNFIHSASPPPTTPVLSPAESRTRARQVCTDESGEISVGQPVLVLRPAAGRLRLVWRVPVSRASTPPAFYAALVDALDRNAAPLRISLLRDAVGTGAVYPENPLLTPLQTVPFQRLDATGMLSGPDARTYNGRNVKNINMLASSSNLKKLPTATSTDRTYIYDPATDSRFSEAMVYYHLSRVQEILKSMGFTTPVKQVPAVVNLPMANAFYCRCDFDAYYDGRGLLGFGDGYDGYMGNFGQDADVIYHEYGHRVLDLIQPAILEGIEHNYGGAYHEAWGDILAAGILGNSKMGEYALTVTGTGEWYGRDLDNNRRYPQNVIYPWWGYSEVHWTGEIIGGVFWDLYEKIGSRALQAFFDANQLLDGSENFFGIRDAVRQAAAPADQDSVDVAFAAHGIAGPDAGNPGRIKKLIDVYTYGSPYGNPGKHTIFEKNEAIFIGVDAIIGETPPGYNLVAEVSVTNAETFAGLYQITGILAEVHNGMNTWRGLDPVTPFVLLPSKDSPSGTYEATVAIRLGGTDEVLTRTVTFTLE